MDNTTNPLVFLPGWGFKGSIWKVVTQSLNSNYILLDLSELGAKLDDIVEHLAIRIMPHSTIIAWSFGGLVAIYFCHKYPHLCRNLILVGSTPKFIAENNWPGILPTNASKFYDHAKDNISLRKNKFICLTQYPYRSTHEKLYMQKHTLSFGGQSNILLQQLDLLFNLDLRAFYKELNISIIHILGGQDAIIPIELAMQLKKLNHLAKVIVIPNASHIPFLSHTSKFIKILKAHTTSLESNTRHIRRSFNKVASTYDDHSNTQQVSGDKLIDLLFKHYPKAVNMIDLGCGTGMVSEKLALKFKYKNFYALDIAEQLLLLARRRLKPYHVKILTGDFQNFNYTNIKFDLVFSNMALHWSLHIEKTLLLIHRNMTNNGYLAFTIPLESTFSELPSSSRNKFFSATEILKLLLEIKFEITDYFEELITVNFDSTLAALRTIKATGANHIHAKPKLNLGKNTSLAKLINSTPHYKGFSLTYHIGYFIVRKNNGH